ncbi:nitroreductase family protein [Candidatus Poriferisodalis sp.]|uniref:nitroreductase family protein n=1 Tax=Candidatus Poriferisodalis sp. TaxID=3101277 RepID=UPI003B5A6895
MTLSLSADEVLATTRAVRRRLDFDRPVAENFPRTPAIFIPCIEGRLDGKPAGLQALRWGSVIQGAWSFCLAARNRGLGTCWTTVHLAREQEVAEILGIPYDDVQQVALLPVAHTMGTDFKPGRRKSFDQFVHVNGW